MISNLAEYGNTSAASIPLALDEAVRGGSIQPGDTVRRLDSATSCILHSAPISRWTGRGGIEREDTVCSNVSPSNRTLHPVVPASCRLGLGCRLYVDAAEILEAIAIVCRTSLVPSSGGDEVSGCLYRLPWRDLAPDSRGHLPS